MAGTLFGYRCRDVWILTPGFRNAVNSLGQDPCSENTGIGFNQNLGFDFLIVYIPFFSI